MSAIELDAFEAFIDALDEASHQISGREVGAILRHLYDAGWRLTREPEKVTIPEAAPLIVAPAPTEDDPGIPF
jgi:hypothetical protein